MFQNYNNLKNDEPKAGRSAFEIYVDAIEYEKWRMINEYHLQSQPLVENTGGKKTGWAALLKAPLRLFMNLFS